MKTSHIIVATKVSRENFEELSAKHKDLRLMWKDETVILYEYPIKVKHQYCISFINTTLSSIPHIIACGHPTMVTANWEREGDQSWASRRFLANPGAGECFTQSLGTVVTSAKTVVYNTWEQLFFCCCEQLFFVVVAQLF